MRHEKASGHPPCTGPDLILHLLPPRSLQHPPAEAGVLTRPLVQSECGCLECAAAASAPIENRESCRAICEAAYGDTEGSGRGLPSLPWPWQRGAEPGADRSHGSTDEVRDSPVSSDCGAS